MSTVPGPVIRFLIDSPGLSAAVGPAMQQVRDQARATTAAIADDWKRLSAQIRAETATGISSQQTLNAERQKLVGILDREISGLRQRNELTNKELSTLKAVTLERERQVDAIKRGVGVGVTSGTSSALGQVSTQTMLGLERVLDSLVNRYFGGAAGALTRTARDVGYYSNQAKGGSGGGLLSMLTSPTGLALGGVAAAGAGVAVLTDLAVKGGNLAVELTKLSEKTGLTTEEVIKLRSASSVLDVDFDRVTVGFKKFSSELVLASTAHLPNASKEAKQAAALFKALGVDVKKAAQDPYAALQQLAKTFQSLPDGIVKTNAATALFGRGGIEVIPVFDKLESAMALTAKSSKDLSDALTGGKGVVDATEAMRSQLVNFRNDTDALQVSLAKNLLPTLVGVVNWVNELGSGKHPLAAAALTGGGSVEAKAGEWIGQKFLGIANFGAGPDASSAVATVVAQQSAAASAAATKQSLAVQAALGKVGDGAKAAEEAQRKANEAMEKTFRDWEKMMTEPSKRNSVVDLQARHDAEINRILGIAPPNINLPGQDLSALSPILGPLGGTGFGPVDVTEQLKKVKEEYLQTVRPQAGTDDFQKEIQEDTEKIKAKYDEQLDYWKFVQAQYPTYAQQAADAITKIQQIENQKLADLQQKAFEKYKSESDKLFDDLLSGKTKSFTKTLEKDIEDIVTEPARKMFENMMGKMLQGLDQAINGKGGAGTGAGSGSSSGLGGFGGVLARIGIGGTAGTFPGSTGLGGKNGTGSVAISSGQTGVMTNTMNVQANVVNIGTSTSTASSSGSGIPGASNFTGGGLLPAFGSFFGNNNPFGGGTGFWGNNNPLGGATSAGGSLLNGQLGPLVGGLLVGGLGVKSGSISSEAMGAAGVATALANIAGASNASPIGYPGPNGPSNLGSQLGGIFGGLGQMASGIAAGGLGGTLQSAAGGAMIGTMILPGIGTAIGAAAGALAGALSSIIGGESWKESVKHDMNKQSVYLPPAETFNFAEGSSISQTMSQGFSQSGSTFSTFALPSNTPFWANPIYGPLSKLQQQKLAAEEGGFIPGQPFGGLPSVNPFTGQGPVTSKKDSTTPNVNVQFNLPGLMDQNAATAVFQQHGTLIAGIVGNAITSTNSGIGRNIRSAVALP